MAAELLSAWAEASFGPATREGRMRRNDSIARGFGGLVPRGGRGHRGLGGRRGARVLDRGRCPRLTVLEQATEANHGFAVTRDRRLPTCSSAALRSV